MPKTQIDIAEYQQWAKSVNCFKAFPEVKALHDALAGIDEVKFHKLKALYGIGGLTSEVGEVASVLHKSCRHTNPPSIPDLKDELGDVLAWLVFIANIYDVDLAEVLARTQIKLIHKYKLTDAS